MNETAACKADKAKLSKSLLENPLILLMPGVGPLVWLSTLFINIYYVSFTREPVAQVCV